MFLDIKNTQKHIFAIGGTNPNLHFAISVKFSGGGGLAGSCDKTRNTQFILHIIDILIRSKQDAMSNIQHAVSNGQVETCSMITSRTICDRPAGGSRES